MSTTPESRRRPPRGDVRRALLDAAARVFARQGIDSSSLDDVAREAGFTKGAVYSNFDGKDALVRALAEERTAAYLTLGLEAVDDDEASLGTLAQRLGDRLTAASTEQREWHILFFELWQRAVRTGEDQGAFVTHREALHAAVAAAIAERAEQTATTLPVPPAELAVLLMALVNGMALERLLAPDDVPDDLMGRALSLLVGDPGPPPAG